MNRDYSVMELFGNITIFTDVKDKKMDELQGLDGLYRYDLRHGDDFGTPVTLERNVAVNRYGTVYSAVPLLADDQKYRTIGEKDWGFI